MALGLTLKPGEFLTIKTPEGREAKIIVKKKGSFLIRLVVVADREIEIQRSSRKEKAK
jgi:hypothetical protein